VKSHELVENPPRSLVITSTAVLVTEDSIWLVKRARRSLCETSDRKLCTQHGLLKTYAADIVCKRQPTMYSFGFS
jgi:hypothetical protein